MVADNPLKILEHARQGVLMPDEVATVKATNPKVYEEMTQAVIKELTTKPPDSLAKRQQLATLLGQPVDYITSPAFRSSMQMIGSTPPPAPSGPPNSRAHKASQKGLDKLRIAEASSLPQHGNKETA
jgi:uracil DNA glycosylase